ncbi:MULTISPECIES: Rieske 2Fe-2S domain-containing protein [Fischerella]|uniref:(2Fe-2S)-binding protein n=1 Tax=Fischerella muscicola CCMEE 5323 TaxID=2019572 RepID=A0A2N6K307_FISMU|nr:MULTISPECIES: Rieske 2Fe-2S domain-containing protein [Fischerella]MBD2432030.1 Rieske 2Fe-2S domain-containing protein [Fischerella sp. FACHB-380]PLZ89748.1 (2Fe-2S)-binding protein [Fischerella muscicola CCMEE 5323]
MFTHDELLTSATTDDKQKFNWRNFWYPVAFVQDIPVDRPCGFSLYDEPLVLFKNQQGNFTCLQDCCAHRAAKLSDGRVTDGKIECLYHGWQYGGDGKCLYIPQLPADAKIPTKACVQSFLTVERQGILWVWPGKLEIAEIESIPIVPVLDKPGYIHTDYMVDLPHDQTYLIENVLDPAHVSIIHHGSQGNRKDAQPLEIEIIENSTRGIRAKWRGTKKPDQVWHDVEFVAPNLVHNIINLGQRGWCVGLVSYGVPLGKGRCRLLFRGYRNFLPFTLQFQPRWFQHFKWNKILEQDFDVIARQQQQIEQLGKSLKEIYLPLKTTDTLVIAYRKWLDQVGDGLPFYQGYATSKYPEEKISPNNFLLQDRFSRHTQICSSCHQTYQIITRLEQAAISFAVGIAALAIVIDGSGYQKITALIACLLSLALAGIFDQFKIRFEHSYQD